MTSCTNEEPKYFGTKTRHVKANTFTIESVGVYVLPRVLLLIGRCRPSKRVSQREACGQTVVQAHWEVSPLTRLCRPPSSQLLPLLMSPAPQFKINPALPGIATILSLPLRFSLSTSNKPDLTVRLISLCGLTHGIPTGVALPLPGTVCAFWHTYMMVSLASI